MVHLSTKRAASRKIKKEAFCIVPVTPAAKLAFKNKAQDEDVIGEQSTNNAAWIFSREHLVTFFEEKMLSFN
ncbi:hypothetical protein AOLI_G00318600 [Acnodon oligacanthus]